MNKGEQSCERDHTIKRSICPFLNSMANEGRVNTSGMFTCDEIVSETFQIANVSKSLMRMLLSSLKTMKMILKDDIVDLSKLNAHGFIGHDASLTRNDSVLQSTGFIAQLHPDGDLIQTLIGFASSDNNISLSDLVKYRNYRKDTSKRNNPRFYWTWFNEFISVGESCLLLSVFGDKKYNIPISTIRTLLYDERLPDNFTPVRHTGFIGLLTLMARFKALSYFN